MNKYSMILKNILNLDQESISNFKKALIMEIVNKIP